MLIIKLFFSTYLIILISYVYGHHTSLIIFNKKNVLNTFEKIIGGIFSLSFIALIINFFSPINEIVNNSLFVIFIILFLFILRNKNINKNILIEIFLVTILTVLILSYSNFQEDYPWYSIPYISQLNFEKISFGISNVQFRFGHISILQYGSSTIPNFILDKEFISLPNLIVFTCFCFWLIKKIIFSNIYKKQINIYFYLFFVSIFVFTKFTRFSEYGNDVPAHALIFIIIYLYLKFDQNKPDDSEFKKIIFFSTFVILQKVQYLLIFIFPFYLVFKNKKLIKKNLTVVSICFLLIITWLAKNYITTSCLLFPSSITCNANVEWAAPNKENHAFPKKVYNMSSAWAKGWPDQIEKKLNYQSYLKNFNWFRTWSNGHGLLIIKKLLPFLIISIIFLFFNFYKYNFKKKEIIKNFKFSFNSLLLLTLAILFWLNTFPIFRYNAAFIVCFISIVLSCFVFTKNKQIIFTSKILTIVAFLFLIIKNIDRINNSYKENYIIPVIYNDIGYIKFPNDINQIIKPISGGCFYTKSICSHHEHLETISVKKFGAYNLYFYKK